MVYDQGWTKLTVAQLQIALQTPQPGDTDTCRYPTRGGVEPRGGPLSDLGGALCRIKRGEDSADGSLSSRGAGIQRAQERSAIAAAAYCYGAVLYDQRLEMPFGYSARGGGDHIEVMAPEATPAPAGAAKLCGSGRKPRTSGLTRGGRETCCWRCRPS